MEGINTNYVPPEQVRGQSIAGPATNQSSQAEEVQRQQQQKEETQRTQKTTEQGKGERVNTTA